MQALRQFKLLGYKEEDQAYIRILKGKQPKPDAFKAAGLEPKDYYSKVSPRSIDYKVADIGKFQQNDGAAIYLVVNGQAHKADGIKYGRAMFAEFDHKELFKLGIEADGILDYIQSKGLPEPTFSVTSRHGLHVYWTLTELLEIEQWKALQEDLIQHLGSDPSIKDPPRLMRLSGFAHVEVDLHGNYLEEFICELVEGSCQPYLYQELRAIVEPKPVVSVDQFAGQEYQTKYTEARTGEIPLIKLLAIENRNTILNGAPEGHRNDALVKLAADLLGVEDWCKRTGQKYQGSAKDLLAEAHTKSKCDLDRKFEKMLEWSSNAKPSLSEDKLLNCISAWYNTKPKLEQAVVKEQGQEKTETIRQPTFGEIVSVKGRLGKFQITKEPQITINPATQEIIEEKDERGKPILVKTRTFKALTDWDFEVIDILNNDEGDAALVLKIKSVNGYTKEVLLRDEHCHSLKDFTRALSRGHGSTLTTNLTLNELNELKDQRKQEYIKAGGKSHNLAIYIGRQENGYWVFENIQFNPEGKVCTKHESSYVYYPNYTDGPELLSPKILPPNPEILSKYLKTVRKYIGPTSMLPTLFVMAGMVMNLFCKEIHAHKNGVPIVNVTGERNTGKSRAADLALALVGLYGKSRGNISASAMFETLKNISGIGLVIDDPEKSDEFDATLKEVHNQAPRVRRGNVQQPRSSVIVTSNHTLGERSSALTSRFVKIPTYDSNHEVDSSYKLQLEDVINQASGCFSTLLQFGYDREAIHQLDLELEQHMGKTNARNKSHIGLLLFYALKLAPYAGLSEQQVKHYAQTLLCSTANTDESNRDNLTDFLIKLQELEAESLIGPWNYKRIKLRDTRTDEMKTYAVVKLDSVWKILNDKYKVYYGRGEIKDLLNSRKDIEQSTQRFAKDKQTWNIWNQLFIRGETDKACATVSFRCLKIEIPEELLDHYEELEVQQFESSEPIAPVPIAPEPIAPEPEPVSEQSQIKEAMAELDQITYQIDYEDWCIKWGSHPETIGAKVHKQMPHHVHNRLRALARGEIPKIHHVKPAEVPDWCPYQPGQLVDRNGSPCWFVGITDTKAPDTPSKIAGKEQILDIYSNGTIYCTPLEKLKPWRD